MRPSEGLDLACDFVPSTQRVFEEESDPLACASAQGRRRAVRALLLAIHHKVGCSWSARATGSIPMRSAGPTTPPRFERIGIDPVARQTGEPTVSHEGCSGPDSSSIFSTATIVSEKESTSLACAPAQGRRRAVRAKSVVILHKVGCSWSARPRALLREASAGPTTPPRFEASRSSARGRQTGEPTVSHEGCSGDGSFSTFSQVSHG